MAWTVRRYSKGQIDRAGIVLANFRSSRPEEELDAAIVELDAALRVIDNWRACHSYPLQIVKMTLLNRAKKVDSSALIAQRLKRLPSIAIKLRHNSSMKLSQMQDIGGCRAVLSTISDVKKLIALYEKSHLKNPRQGRPIQHEKYDYILSPKPDGYRSYHLIFKYQSEYEEKMVFDGQRIEVQIRSKLQHAWATAVETVQTFTGLALKSKIKTGDPRWLRFFALMGTAMALRERCAVVPDIPLDRDELVSELRSLSDELKVEEVLVSWGSAVQSLTASTGNAVAFLLELNPIEKTLTTRPFSQDEMEKANEMYSRLEKATEDRPEIQVVLVSVESVEALRAAYPNYYLDTGAFIGAMKQAMSKTKRK